MQVLLSSIGSRGDVQPEVIRHAQELPSQMELHAARIPAERLTNEFD